MTLAHVSDTARWVAHYRALESVRPDALFRDPYARALAGTRGAAIVNTLPGGRAAAGGLIVRTRVFDELIERAIHQHDVDTVVNLGAGLDARPFRLALPAGLKWIEIDLPDILTEKATVIGDARPACTLERVAMDLADVTLRRATFAKITAQARRVLVISEGLTVYLRPEDVAALDDDLRSQPAVEFMVTDLCSPWYFERQRRQWGKHLAQARAEWRFAPAEGSHFFTSRGWRVVEARSAVTEGLRLHRAPYEWLARTALRIGPAVWRKRMEHAVQYLLLRRN